MLNIALEGIDNAGKTTLSKKLVDDLQKENIKVVISKELTTDVGNIIKLAFKNNTKLSPKQKTLLFASDRLERYQELQKQDIDVVIWDRYVYSALVYREMESCDMDWVKEVNIIFPNADLNIYLDVDIDLSIKRGIEANKPCPYSKEQLQKCKDIYSRYILNSELISVNSISDYEKIKNMIIEKFHEK